MKAVETYDKSSVTVRYNAAKQNLMYLVAGKPVYGFIGGFAEKKFLESLDQGLNVEIISQTMDIKQKIRQFRAIIAKKGLVDIKDDILAQYGVKSTTELKECQLDELIANLNNTSAPAEIRDQRSIVLNLLQKLNITGSKLDGWDRVNSFLEQPRIAGKKLYEMNVPELKACASRIRSIIYKAKTSDSIE